MQGEGTQRVVPPVQVPLGRVVRSGILIHIGVAATHYT